MPIIHYMLGCDNVSNAVAVQTGDMGIASGTNLTDTNAMFGAVHSAVHRHSGQNKVNPGSFILSSEKMLRRMGRGEAAGLVFNETIINNR
jgi:isocitrate dehydrogenase